MVCAVCLAMFFFLNCDLIIRRDVFSANGATDANHNTQCAKRFACTSGLCLQAPISDKHILATFPVFTYLIVMFLSPDFLCHNEPTFCPINILAACKLLMYFGPCTWLVALVFDAMDYTLWWSNFGTKFSSADGLSVWHCWEYIIIVRGFLIPSSLTPK